jgi:hypothetical protein
VCHVVGCIWVLLAQLEDEEKENSWLTSFVEDYDKNQIYLTSFYFTVTTITTVGYGDISGHTKAEKIFCILIMVIGVISFSFASGSLASVIQNYDNENAKLKEQLNILNKMYKEYCFPLDLFVKLKQSLKYNYSQDFDDYSNFVDDLPHNLKIEVSLYLHEETYKTMSFL